MESNILQKSSIHQIPPSGKSLVFENLKANIYYENDLYVVKIDLSEWDNHYINYSDFAVAGYFKDHYFPYLNYQENQRCSLLKRNFKGLKFEDKLSESQIFFLLGNLCVFYISFGKKVFKIKTSALCSRKTTHLSQMNRPDSIITPKKEIKYNASILIENFDDLPYPNARIWATLEDDKR